jgi:hypothetical protein
MWRICAWFCLTLAPGGIVGQSIQQRTYEDAQEGFSVVYPGEWYTEPAAKGFRIYSIAPSKLVPQLLLPPGAALIAFAGMKQPVRTVEEWIRIDSAGRKAEEQSSFLLRVPRAQADVKVIEVLSRWSAGAVIFEQIDWYFELQRKLFDAQLLYREGGVGGVERYRGTFKSVVASIVIKGR